MVICNSISLGIKPYSDFQCAIISLSIHKIVQFLRFFIPILKPKYRDGNC